MSEMVLEQMPRTITKYYIQRTLGSGMSAKVRLGVDSESSKQVALKLVDREKLTNRQMEMLDREISTMKALSHSNVLQLLDVEMNASYTKKNGKTRQVALLVIELAPGGELFEFLMHTGPFSEIQARTYFSSLLSALEACHSQGIFHRDLKPENLMLDDEYQLKVADFGLSSMIMTDGPETEVLLETECGTRSYMSPEILAHQRYHGSKADIWSAGVVLFIMMTGHPPFQMAVERDWWFNAVKQNRHDRFWAAHLRTNPDVPPEFQAFINTIFVADPEQRTTLEAMKSHEWMQGETLSPADLKQQIEQRKIQVDAAKEAEKQKARAEKAAKMARAALGQTNAHATNTYRKLGDLIPPPLPEDLVKSDVFYSSETAEAILASIKAACTEMGAQILKEPYCKIKAAFQPSPESGSNRVEISFQIYTVQDTNEEGEPDDICVLHLQRRVGDLFEYQKIHKAFKDKISNVLPSVDEMQMRSELVEEEPLTDTVDLI